MHVHCEICDRYFLLLGNDMTDMTDLNTVKAKKKGRGKVLLLIMALPLLLGGGGAYVYFFNPSLLGLGGAATEGVSITSEGDEDVETYANIIPLEEIIINIRDRDFQRLFKLSISLELVNAGDNPEVMKNLPILLDSFQSHLRGLRISEIEGSRAIYRIKEELITRANIILHPVRIKNILFAELLIQ